MMIIVALIEGQYMFYRDLHRILLRYHMGATAPAPTKSPSAISWLNLIQNSSEKLSQMLREISPDRPRTDHFKEWSRIEKPTWLCSHRIRIHAEKSNYFFCSRRRVCAKNYSRDDWQPLTSKARASRVVWIRAELCRVLITVSRKQSAHDLLRCFCESRRRFVARLFAAFHISPPSESHVPPRQKPTLFLDQSEIVWRFLYKRTATLAPGITS